MKKVLAFTLAETLITLVVIGVVAAITVPMIQMKHQKEQTVTKLKKAFSDFGNCVQMARADFGDPAYWDYTLNSNDFFNTYLYRYVQLSDQTIADARADNTIYRQTSGREETGLLIMRNQGRIVEMTSGLQFFTYPLGYGTDGKFKRKCYAVDINGYKNPNKFGRDLFMFCLDGDKGQVVPHWWDDNEGHNVTKGRDKLLKGPSQESYQCSKSARGMWCAAVIMADGWQIKDDYPW